MKFCIVLLAVVAAVCAEEMAASDASMKTKRGLSLSLGYHHPAVVSHSYVAPAPVYAHHAPVVAAYHAPIAKTYVSKTYVSPVVHHAPIVHHAPVVHAAAYHAPIVHHAPAYAAYHAAPVLAYHRR